MWRQETIEQDVNIMAKVWNTVLQLPDGMCLYDIQLKGAQPVPHTNATLTFLSLVENAKVPANFKNGADYAVSTSSPESKLWFSGHLFRARGSTGKTEISQTKNVFDEDDQSYTGVLANVATTSGPQGREYVAQILFRGVLDDTMMKIRAWYISSEQLAGDKTRFVDPPQNSKSFVAVAASATGPVTEHIKTETERSVSSLPAPSSDDLSNPLADLFDQAQELRRRNNGRGGAAVSALAAGALANSNKSFKRKIVDTVSRSLKSPRLPTLISAFHSPRNNAEYDQTFDSKSFRTDREMPTLDHTSTGDELGSDSMRQANLRLLAEWVSQCLTIPDYRSNSNGTDIIGGGELEDLVTADDSHHSTHPEMIIEANLSREDAEFYRHIYQATAFTLKNYLLDVPLIGHKDVVCRSIRRIVNVFMEAKSQIDMAVLSNLNS